MSRKIVCISYINESAEFIEVERSNNGILTLSPTFAFTTESLQAACSRADDIYVNSLFPSVQYDRKTFPKVPERYLRSLVTSSIQGKNKASRTSVRYQHIRDVMLDGNISSLVALQSVAKKDVEHIFDLLKKFRKKVKYVYSLPTALAGAVVHSEKPESNSLVLWVKENISIIAVISADGIVHIARSLPHVIPGGEGSDTWKTAAAGFSEDISGEVMMTVNYFKQHFREADPEKMYILGDGILQKIFEDFPIQFPDISLQFGLSGNTPEGIDVEKFNKNAHLFGSLFANESFSYIPVREIADRKLNNILSGALAGLLLLIGLAGLWTFSIPDQQSHNDLVNRIQELRSNIQEQETSITALKPTEARKKYYESVFLNKRPEFMGILQEIAKITPPEMAFESFTMSPAEGGWICMITGKIKGRDWQKRLDVLREFGHGLYSFPNIDIQNITHSLGQGGMDSETINFQLSLQIIPGEEKK